MNAIDQIPEGNFVARVQEAILLKQSPNETDRSAHLGRYVTALEMIRGIAKPDLRVVDVASFGTIVPALRTVLGMKDVTATGIPWEGKAAHEEIRFPVTPEGDAIVCPFDRFDIEGSFPYADGTFDLVILTEVLEHITRDPMHTIGEISRITKPGGWLLLSTPNCSSLRSVIKALRGHQPCLWAQYSALGHRDRHNREYTASEVIALLEDAGYQIVRVVTRDDSYGAASSRTKRCLKWFANRALALASLMAGHYVPPRLRGESTFALVRKCTAVKTRYPEFLYYERDAAK